MIEHLQGTVAPGFEAVRDEFVANFTDSVDVGAGFCATVGDRVVVDLSAGHCDPKGEQPWQTDTLVNVYSTTKGLAALAVAWVVEQGLLDYDAEVRTYWPELRAGQSGLTVGQLLSHQGGICGVSETITVADLCDWPRMIALLENQEPFWAPGTGAGYHAVVWGYLAGQLVRIATGRTLGDVFRQEIAAPLDADCWIGLPEAEMARVAPMISAARARILPDPADLAGFAPPDLYKVALENPVIRPYADASSQPWQAAEIAAANGHATARGIALVYAAAANGGSFAGTRVLRPETLEAMVQEEVGAEDDLVLGRPLRRGRGVILNTDDAYGGGPDSFGHGGAGGSVGFADPVAKVAVGYAMNQMQMNLDNDTRAGRLTRALYRCLS